MQPPCDCTSLTLILCLSRFAEVLQLGDCRRVQLLLISPKAQVLSVLCGKNHSVRLFSWVELETPESPGTKIAETKNCQTMVSGLICRGTTSVLCVASKRQVLCYQLTPSRPHSRRIKEIQAQGYVQCLDIMGDRLCIGYPSGFSIYPLLNEAAPVHLPHPEDPRGVAVAQMEALRAVEVSLSELILCFSGLGLYVDGQGRRTRQQELMWPATPLSCCEWRVCGVKGGWGQARADGGGSCSQRCCMHGAEESSVLSSRGQQMPHHQNRLRQITPKAI